MILTIKEQEEGNVYSDFEEEFCILCNNVFIIGDTGNELGFCCKCQEDESFPYDLNKYYEDLDNGKTIFKGFDTMGRGILEPYKKESKFDRKVNDEVD